jgi:hypothetical protein
LAPGIELLQGEKERGEKSRQRQVVDCEMVKLVAMNSQVTHSPETPFIFLVDLHPHQVRHDLRQSLIMVALDPDHLHPPFGIGKPADIRKKLPVLFLQAAEVQITEDVAQKDEPAEGIPLQHGQRGSRTAYFRTQVQIGENHRVETRSIHAFYIHKSCYSIMNRGQKTLGGTIFGNNMEFIAESQAVNVRVIFCGFTAELRIVFHFEEIGMEL